MGVSSVNGSCWRGGLASPSMFWTPARELDPNRMVEVFGGSPGSGQGCMFYKWPPLQRTAGPAGELGSLPHPVFPSLPPPPESTPGAGSTIPHLGFTEASQPGGYEHKL